MSYLCYGTFATVLKLCAAGTRYQSKLSNSMLATVDPHGLKRNESQATRLFNCEIELNEADIIIPARRTNPQYIADRFQTNIMELLNPNKLKLAILAIIDIILNDKTIDEDTTICEYCRITKGQRMRTGRKDITSSRWPGR